MAFESPCDTEILLAMFATFICNCIDNCTVQRDKCNLSNQKKLALKFKGNKQLHQICKQMSDNYSKRQTIAFELCFLS